MKSFGNRNKCQTYNMYGIGVFRNMFMWKSNASNFLSSNTWYPKQMIFPMYKITQQCYSIKLEIQKCTFKCFIYFTKFIIAASLLVNDINHCKYAIYFCIVIIIYNKYIMIIQLGWYKNGSFLKNVLQKCLVQKFVFY